MPSYQEPSTADKFKTKVASLLGTEPEHVEIFSITDVPVSDQPVYPQIFEPPTVDIVFAAHGSPYYERSRIYGLMAENIEEVRNLYIGSNLCSRTFFVFPRLRSLLNL